MNVQAVANQLTGLVKDNETQLAPTLARLNSVLDVLQKNKDNLRDGIDGLVKFQARWARRSPAARSSTPTCRT